MCQNRHYWFGVLHPNKVCTETYLIFGAVPPLAPSFCAPCLGRPLPRPLPPPRLEAPLPRPPPEVVELLSLLRGVFRPPLLPTIFQQLQTLWKPLLPQTHACGNGHNEPKAQPPALLKSKQTERVNWHWRLEFKIWIFSLLQYAFANALLQISLYLN